MANITPLEGGITNRNFRIELPEQILVKRLGGDGTHLLGIDRCCEHAATAIAAEAGVGAQVVYSNAEEDLLVTRFIDGAHLTAEAAVRPETMARIVDTIRRCHAGAAFPCAFSPFDFVRKSLRLAQERGANLPAGAPAAVQRMAQVETCLGPLAQPRPCHNDLLTANFIDDGERIRIIDWEYAGMGDMWFDLGNFAANHDLDEDGSRRLLQLYFGGTPDARALARLTIMRCVSDLREAFWGFVQMCVSTLDFDFAAYGQRHLQRFQEGTTDALLAQTSSTPS